jgi:putative ABC transport system substrate-binding protein
MRRRKFIGLLGGAVAWPVVARAQQPMPVVGVLWGTALESDRAAAFRRGLTETGHVEGRNLSVEYRWARGQNERLPELAAELVRVKPAVIVASPLPAALAAKHATSEIPIVFTSGSDPVKAGLVSSLNRPNGNLTGISQFTTALTAKRLELLRELARQPKLIAFLVNPDNPQADSEVSDIQDAARSLGQTTLIVNASTEREIEDSFLMMVRQQITALIVGAGPFLFGRRSEIVALANRYTISAIYTFRDFATVGGLISYGTDLNEVFRQAGIYAGRILKGSKPVDLPVMQPTKFELVINLKTAKALGLMVPDNLLALADEVIE